MPVSKAKKYPISLDGQSSEGKIGCSLAPKKPDYICNFRAPDKEHYQVWLDFKELAQSKGMDVCYLTLSLIQAWLKSNKDPKVTQQITNTTQIINIQQQNIFQYNVQKPRRLPSEVICSGTKFDSTLRSLFVQAYIMEKASDLYRPFQFMDFQELGHNLFRKTILELKKRKKVRPISPRTNPQFYELTIQK